MNVIKKRYTRKKANLKFSRGKEALEVKMIPKKSALEKEWQRLVKQEEKFLNKRQEKKISYLNQKLEGKVPEKLQGMLDKAFVKAFALVFEKGTGIIEKTYKKEEIEQNRKIQEYTIELKQDRRSLRKLTNTAAQSGLKNLVVSGVMGIGMGAVGVGIPDIPVLTSMILKSIYEIALRYGYTYDSEEERQYILLLIQGAISYERPVLEVDEAINSYIAKGVFAKKLPLKEQIEETAQGLSKELLYMKFLQGIPIVGVVGGAYDALYMRQITEYAELKYRRRYLVETKRLGNMS